MNPTEAVHHRTVLDDEGRHAAAVYAEALYRAAEQTGQADDLRSELEQLVGEVFRQAPELELLLSSPAVARDRKQEVLDRVLGGRASDLLLHALRVLNQHERLDLLRYVAEAYGKMVDRRSGRVAVSVRSAVPLNDEQRGRLSRTLHEVLGKEPVLQESTDPTLLGGLVVQVGDWVYDASVRTRLATMRNQLIERSSHGIEGGRDRFGT